VLYDASGAYTWAIIASAASSLLALPLALYLPRHGRLVVSGYKTVGTA
jgi:hypothetical protein